MIRKAQPAQLLQPGEVLPSAEIAHMSTEAKRRYARELIEAGSNLLKETEIEDTSAAGGSA